jgi:hypothetical protein
MAAPKGFKKVETGISGFWKPTKAGHSLQGVVGHAVETKGADGKPNTFYMLRLKTDDSGPIATGAGKVVRAVEGMVVGVGGRTLQTFLGERIGQEVFLEYKGLGDAKRGQSAPKLYDCYETLTPSDL